LDDGLDAARGLLMGAIVGAAFWLILLAPVIFGWFFPAARGAFGTILS
jgi:hypothetical protein